MAWMNENPHTLPCSAGESQQFLVQPTWTIDVVRAPWWLLLSYFRKPQQFLFHFSDQFGSNWLFDAIKSRILLSPALQADLALQGACPR